MTPLATGFDELRVSIERLRTLLENLVVRGLRACGSEELSQLQMFIDEFERAGAAHIASALAALHAQAEKGERQAARALLSAQVSVRMLERLLTLRAVDSSYEMAANPGAPSGCGSELDEGCPGDDGEDP